ncbi:MAG: GNAT family N-acetyltransferase [Xanthomonadales bacterium]|jgi:ElaA protein|nr:GNAT family N-acetyltransferase [Xanthomonadales bacterium]
MSHTDAPAASSQDTTHGHIEWRWQRFDELDIHSLYTLCAARVAIFVVEQECAYQELDHQDQQAYHLSAWNEQQQLLAYSRILGPGPRYATPSIGRVITTQKARGMGLGRQLMQRSVAHCDALFPGSDIRLSAQHHLEHFYQSFGFNSCSEMYLEDGIPHIDMQRPAP